MTKLRINFASRLVKLNSEPPTCHSLDHVSAFLSHKASAISLLCLTQVMKTYPDSRLPKKLNVFFFLYESGSQEMLPCLRLIEFLHVSLFPVLKEIKVR